MAGDWLLGRLTDKNLTNIAEDVHAYLTPVITQELEDSDKRKYGLFSANFLRGSIKCLESCNSGLISAIHTAYQCFQQTRSLLPLSQPLFLVQVLYHIFLKLSQKGDISDCLSIANYILEEVRDDGEGDEVLCNIITSVYHTLWNTATKIEAQQGGAASALKARHVGLRFIALQKPVDVFTQKVVIAMLRYGQMLSKQKNGSDGQECVEILNSVCDDLCIVLSNKYSHSDSSIMFIKLLQFKELWGRGNLAEASNCLDSLHHISDTSKAALVHVSVCMLLCKTCLTLSYLKQGLKLKRFEDRLRTAVTELSEVLEQHKSLLHTKTPDEKLIDDLKALVIMLSASCTGEAKSLLNICSNSRDGLDILSLIVSILKYQTRFHLDSCDGDLSKVQKSWAMNLQSDKTLSSMYLLQLQCLHVILQKCYSKDKDVVPQALEVIQDLEDQLMKITNNRKNEKSAMLEKHFLGTMAQNLGNVCYTNKDDETAVLFYKVACKQLTEWCELDTVKKGDKTEEVNLWKSYASLSECYRRLGQHRDAMETVINCMTVERSHTMSAAKLWVRVKKDLLKHDQLNDEILLRSLMESVIKRGVNLQVSEKKDLLEKEVKVYRTYRSVCKLHEAELRCHDELLELCTVNVEKAAVLVEETKLLWLHPTLASDRSCLSCAEQAVAMLSNESCQSPVVSATSAEACLWLYIAKTKQLREQTSVPVLWGSKTCEESDNGEDKPVAKTKPEGVYITVKAEGKLLMLLDKALSLWSNCVSDNHLCEELDSAAISHSLQLCAVIYYSSGKALKGLECLKLVKKLTPASATSSSSTSLTMDCLVRMWSEVDHPAMVSMTLEEWNCPEDLTHCLRKAQHALRLGMLDECGKIAADVLEKVQSVQPRTRESCLLEGTALRLLSKLATVTEGEVGRRLGVRANSSHLAKESAHCHASVLHFLLGKDLNEPMVTKSAQPVDQWLVVTEVLPSLLHLGRIYLMTGYKRRAACYLEQGLRMAQVLAIPRWCVSYLVELARLNSVTGSLEDTNMYLQQARDILYTDDDFTSAGDTDQDMISTGDLPTKKSELKTTNPAIQDSCFGFSSPQLAEAEPTEFALHTIPLLISRDRSLSEESEFSSRELLPQNEPELLTHKTDCVCQSCADITSHRIYANYLLTLCEHYLSNSIADKALDAVRSAQLFLDKLAKKLPLLIKSLSHENSENSYKVQTSVSDPLAWMRIMRGKVLCCLAKAHLCHGNRTLSLAAANQGQLLVSGHNTGLSDMIHLEAQLQLCKVQALWRLPVMATPPLCSVRTSVVDSLMKTPATLQPMSLAKSFQKLILDDEDIQCENHGKKVRGKSRNATVRGTVQKSDKNVVCVLDSDDECYNKSAKKSKTTKKLESPDKLIIEESDLEDNCSVSSKDTTSDLCEELDKLSIKTTKSRNTKMSVKSKDQENKAIKKGGRDSCRHPTNTGMAVNESVDVEPLKPKRTRQKAKPVTELDAEKKPTATRRARATLSNSAATPQKQQIKPENVFDFDATEGPKAVQKKSRSASSKVKSTGPDNVTKTTRNKRQKNVNEIEVGRSMDPSLGCTETDCHIPVFSICEDSGSELPLSPVYEADTSPLNYMSYVQTENMLSGKMLNHSDTLLPVNLSFDTSIEMDRAASDDETPLRSRTSRRKPVRKKSAKDKEETEISRASHIPSYKKTVKKSKSERPTLNGSYSQEVLNNISTNSENSVVPASGDFIQELEDTLKTILPFPPLFLYRDICQYLSLQYLHKCPTSAAHYLSESMAITLRHRAHFKLATQHKQLQKAGVCIDEDTTVSKLCFGQMNITKTLDYLPEEWTVCMLSVVENAPGESEVIISRLQRGVEPVVRRVTSFTSDQMQSVLTRFSEVLEGSQKAMKITNKREWWKLRKQLDDDLQELLIHLENDCLRGWKSLLVGQPADLNDQCLLAESAADVSAQMDLSLAQVLLSCSNNMSENDLSELLIELTGHQPGSPEHTHLKTTIQERSKQLPTHSPRHPLILILDQHLQHLPWESIPVLRGQPVCRFPSLHHLHSQLLAEERRSHSALRDGIDAKSTFYILNPDNNLPSTETHFQKMFEQQPGWKGLTGESPNKEQFTEALTEHQLLVYCGHGAGSKYLPGDEIQFLQCKATALLLGCSSGRLQVEGQLEPYGMMHNYFLAGCPCVVGNLWDVTDKDIDRLTETLLTTLLDPNKDKCLARVLAQSRQVCRLPYLIGCAPVVYGLPVKFR